MKTFHWTPAGALAHVLNVLDTTTIPDDGYRTRVCDCSIYVIDTWNRAYLYGPVWANETP